MEILISFLSGGAFVAILVLLKRAFAKQVDIEPISEKGIKKKRAFYTYINTAINDLSHLCKKNPKLIHPYMVLGNLYRVRGEPQRSVVVHQNLLADESLSKNMRDRVRIELSNDLIDAGMEEKALPTLQEIHYRSPFYIQAQEKISEVYRIKGNYLDAFSAIQAALRKRKSAVNRRRAGYLLASHAEKLIDMGDLPGAKKTLSRALSFDRGCLLALYRKGEVSLLERKYDDAIYNFSKIVQLRPKYAFLALPKIEDAYYGKQSFMRLGDTIEKFTENGATDPYIRFAMGRHFRKKKMFKEARETLRQVLDREPSYLPVLDELLALDIEEQRTNDCVSTYQSLIEDAKVNEHYVCNHCHATYSDMQWHCTSCGRWETVAQTFDLMSLRKDKKEATDHAQLRP